MIEHAEPTIEDDTLLVLDLSDVRKKYAKKMENLARVRDGSEKEIGRGYWWLSIVGANTQGTKISPLYRRLFSHAVRGHQSENYDSCSCGLGVEDGKRDRVGITEPGDSRCSWSSKNPSRPNIHFSIPKKMGEVLIFIWLDR